MLKSLLCHDVWLFRMWFQDVSICSKFDHLHTVILVIKTIVCKSFKIQELSFLIFICFFLSYFLLFVSASPQLFHWLCAWNDPETISISGTFTRKHLNVATGFG